MHCRASRRITASEKNMVNACRPGSLVVPNSIFCLFASKVPLGFRFHETRDTVQST